MKNSNLTYEKSGVNIKAADNFVKFISSISKKRGNNKNFQNIGGFGSITNIPKNIKNPQLVASTDGVGTKIEIANELNKFDTIGIDLVAMCVNDLIVQGAKPLIFLDYISINEVRQNKLKNMIFMESSFILKVLPHNMEKLYLKTLLNYVKKISNMHISDILYK